MTTGSENGKRIVDVPGLYDSRPRGYEQCITAGPLVFVAGQVGVDANGQVVSTEFAPQAEQALTNVKLALEAAGVAPADVTAITVYFTDMNNLPALGPLREKILPGLRATSTAIQVSRLARPELLFEITVMAVRAS